MMPKLSGFEVCENHQSATRPTRPIMVLMVTALNESGDIERAVFAGCDDFFSKPVNKLELLKRVENMLTLRQVTDELDRLRRYIDGMEEDRGPERAPRVRRRGRGDQGRPSFRFQRSTLRQQLSQGTLAQRGLCLRQ